MLCDAPVLGVETELVSVTGIGELWSFLLEVKTKSYHVRLVTCGSYSEDYIITVSSFIHTSLGTSFQQN